MKRLAWFLGLSAFAVSLWFNWRTQPAVPPMATTNLTPGVSAVPLPGKVEDMDFSGTGLADEAWQLKPEIPDVPIPQTLPAPETPETIPPPPPGWDLDAALQLDPGPGK